MESKSSLAQARETAGLTVEQISALTNIRVAVIKDLENNSVDICGGIAYARGHIRTIAKVLNQKTPKSGVSGFNISNFMSLILLSFKIIACGL